MSDFEIDFEWPVAPKYEFQPATTEEISRQYGDADYLRAHCAIAGISEADLPFHFGSIVRTGKATKHRPTAQKMLLAVTGLVEYKDAPFHLVALKIVRSLGGLSRGDDEVSQWHLLARYLRQMFEHRTSSTDAGLLQPTPHGHLGIYLIPGKNNNPVLALRPENLRNALILYAARMITNGTTFNICENCKTPFLSGGARGRNKRGDARFCSSECRWKHHNETRRKAR
jgi:hypothetical protein